MNARLHITLGLLLGFAAGPRCPAAFAAPVPTLAEVALSGTLKVSARPAARSPVDQFRRLLAMDPAAREAFLAGRKAEDRDKIRQKLQEYETLNPDARELRLRMTQLRWYLLRFMPTPNTNRTAQLDSVPDPLDRKLVRDRLEVWDLLPSQLQHEVLDNETALRYFVGSSSPPMIDPHLAALPAAERSDLIAKVDQLNALPPDQRERMCRRFLAFFDLTAEEKQSTVAVLPAVQRGQLESALRAFNQLPAGDRQKCLKSFDNFASLNEAQRAEFLQNAGQWQQMSAADRRVWQAVVSHIQPEMAPLPLGLTPPMPNGFHATPPGTN